MRICHLIYDDLRNPWLAGGGAVRAWEIYRRLAARHQITLITGHFPGAYREEWIEGVRFLRVGSGRSYALSRLTYCREAVRRLRGLEWDVWVHEFSAFAPLWAPARLRRRGILFFYHFVGSHALRKHPLVGGVSWVAEALTLRAYPRIVTISPSVRAQVAARLQGRAVQLDCVYTGVAAEYFALAPVEEPYLLYFGRLDIHTKGLDVLVKAFAHVAPDYPGLRLKVAGRSTPRQLAQFRRLVDAAGLACIDRTSPLEAGSAPPGGHSGKSSGSAWSKPGVELVGGVDERQKGELLRRALFACMPSRYEGWGIAAVEAAAAGKAVVGTRIDGLRDAVYDGHTGVLVAAGDAAGLARAMRGLLDDPRQRRRLGAEGREWARRFDWERLAGEQEQVYVRSLDEMMNGAE